MLFRWHTGPDSFGAECFKTSKVWRCTRDTNRTSTVCAATRIAHFQQIKQGVCEQPQQQQMRVLSAEGTSDRLIYGTEKVKPCRKRMGLLTVRTRLFLAPAGLQSFLLLHRRTRCTSARASPASDTIRGQSRHSPTHPNLATSRQPPQHCAGATLAWETCRGQREHFPTH